MKAASQVQAEKDVELAGEVELSGQAVQTVLFSLLQGDDSYSPGKHSRQVCE